MLRDVTPQQKKLALALSLALSLIACSGEKPAAPAMGPMPVTVLEMQPQKAPTSIEIMAQTEGARETEVRARVGGIL
ncbi:MAG: hypothetical protein LWW81_10835, partial [Rhodocyclales bacterium]|nr:hypothetical protein [Rhodocyclales bacterium]